MSGSWTCSPQPQLMQGSKPEAGSFEVLMATVTWRFASAEEVVAASAPPLEALSPQPASAPAASAAPSAPMPPTKARRVMVVRPSPVMSLS